MGHTSSHPRHLQGQPPRGTHLALLPEHAGKRQPGWVIHSRGRLSYEALHDLTRSPRRFSDNIPENDTDDAGERAKKREWVRRQINTLQQAHLVQRGESDTGRRPELIVLSDRADGAAFDDPDGTSGNTYLTIPGRILGTDEFRSWGGPELAAFYCALQADRFAVNVAARSGRTEIPGRATWFRQADWFNGDNPHAQRPEGHVLFPFSTATIERGLKSLRDQELIRGERRLHAPDGRRFSHPRMIYENRFGELPASKNVIDLGERRKQPAV